MVIPQRATYEILAKKYVYIVNNEPPVAEAKKSDEHEAAHGPTHHEKLPADHGEGSEHKS